MKLRYIICSNIYLLYLLVEGVKSAQNCLGHELCDPDWIYYDCKCYWFSGVTKTWEQSRSACEGLDSLLVTLNTEDEKQWILVWLAVERRNHLPALNPKHLIGLHNSSGTWEWLDPTKGNATSSDMALFDSDAKCAELSAIDIINDLGCTNTRHYICEKEAETSQQSSTSREELATSNPIHFGIEVTTYRSRSETANFTRAEKANICKSSTSTAEISTTTQTTELIDITTYVSASETAKETRAENYISTTVTRVKKSIRMTQVVPSSVVNEEQTLDWTTRADSSSTNIATTTDGDPVVFTTNLLQSFASDSKILDTTEELKHTLFIGETVTPTSKSVSQSNPNSPNKLWYETSNFASYSTKKMINTSNFTPSSEEWNSESESRPMLTSNVDLERTTKSISSYGSISFSLESSKSSQSSTNQNITPPHSAESTTPQTTLLTTDLKGRVITTIGKELSTFPTSQQIIENLTDEMTTEETSATTPKITSRPSTPSTTDLSGSTNTLFLLTTTIYSTKSHAVSTTTNQERRLSTLVFTTPEKASRSDTTQNRRFSTEVEPTSIPVLASTENITSPIMIGVDVAGTSIEMSTREREATPYILGKTSFLLTTTITTNQERRLSTLVFTTPEKASRRSDTTQNRRFSTEGEPTSIPILASTENITAPIMIGVDVAGTSIEMSTRERAATPYILEKTTILENYLTSEVQTKSATKRATAMIYETTQSEDMPLVASTADKTSTEKIFPSTSTATTSLTTTLLKIKTTTRRQTTEKTSSMQTTSSTIPLSTVQTIQLNTTKSTSVKSSTTPKITTQTTLEINLKNKFTSPSSTSKTRKGKSSNVLGSTPTTAKLTDSPAKLKPTGRISTKVPITESKPHVNSSNSSNHKLQTSGDFMYTSAVESEGETKNRDGTTVKPSPFHTFTSSRTSLTSSLTEVSKIEATPTKRSHNTTTTSISMTTRYSSSEHLGATPYTNYPKRHEVMSFTGTLKKWTKFTPKLSIAKTETTSKTIIISTPLQTKRLMKHNDQSSTESRGKSPETTQNLPLTEVEDIVVMTLQTFGCIYMLWTVGGTFVTFLFLRDGSPERFLHMNHEIALFAGHVLIVTMRHETQYQIGCKLASLALQFFFLSVFSFMTLEALQTFCIMSNVVSKGGYLTKRQYFVIGWGGPAIISTINFAISHQNYVSTWSCWLNAGHRMAMGTFIPILVLSALTIIITEAGNMQIQPMNPIKDKHQNRAAVGNHIGMLFILPANLASWGFGMWAVYRVDVALYFLVFGCNVTLATVLFICHALGNPKVHGYFSKLWKRMCNK